MDHQSRVLEDLADSLGHSFARRELLEAAVTHASATTRDTDTYERLEFLGDRVLGLIVADMLMRPTLSEEEVEKERDRSIALIAAAKDSSLGSLMPSYTNAFIFGDHPYGNSTFGSETTLAAITQEDVAQFHADNFGGDRLIIAVAGDFELEALKARLSTVFGAWEAAAAPLPGNSAPCEPQISTRPTSSASTREAESNPQISGSPGVARRRNRASDHLRKDPNRGRGRRHPDCFCPGAIGLLARGSAG